MATFLKSGETFSGCEIISRCGKGAVGIAYLAKNPLGQKIVIKIVSSPNNSDRELRGLQHYMKISNSHPNLLHIFHVGATPEGFYYTMEAADDCSSNCEYTPATLGNLLKRYKCFTPEEAIIITRELLEALKIIHQADLIHRDIKPENIIFVNGRAKLSDPGLVVKVGETVSLAGTLGFISPEVMNGAREFDQQCDLYALGKVFYCMVTGFSPAQYPQLPADMRLEVCRQINPVLLKMCNKNPEKRFKSAEEFLSGLPLKLEKPKKWEKILQDFKDYRQCNRGVFNAIFAAMLISLLLLLCCTTAWGIWQKKQHEQSKNWKKIADSFLAINKDRRELTGFQLKHYQPSIYGRYRDLSTSLEKAFQKKQWQTCAKLAIELQQLLEKTAADSMPPFPAGNVSFDRSWQISGAAHSFLATPLAAYADKKKLSAFRKKLAAHDTKLYRNWNGPKCGSEWLNEQFSFYPLIFVPQGAVRLRYLGKTVKLPYHFWICKHETLHASVSQLLGIAPQRSNLSGTPVERISWNDILFFCYILTVNFREHGILPPGYIVRPPTEAEWELAAANAWSGADTTPFSERARFGKNSEKRSWAPGSRKSSKLGLWDMYGNVAEMVIPHTKPRMHNSNIILGGSFLSSNEKACLKRTPYLAYQYIPGSIGFRIAVAPGSMKFFDSHFFLSGPQQTRYDGKVYELVGSISGSFDWINAEKFCRLLGGRLGEFTTEAQLDHVVSSFPLLSSWPAFAGGIKRDGKWVWNHSKKIIDHGKWRPSKPGQGGPHISILGKSFIAVKNMKLPILLCEWDEKEYDKRNEKLRSGQKMPLELTRFRYGTREFMLVRSGIHWNGAFRTCELLGGRLAVLDTPELQKFAIQKLEVFENLKILLGGYAKRNKWYWVNGKEIKFTPKEDRVVFLPSRNRNFLTVKNGVFYNSQWAEAFLCEWDRSSCSSH